MIYPAMSIWDITALTLSIEGVGGTITNNCGEDPMGEEGAIATCGWLHEDVIRALNPERLVKK
jgi:fructose-1,6-bisphosphatase/inositol monophosphatase family enzyme